MDWSRYQSLGNIYRYMQNLQSQYPHVIKVNLIEPTSRLYIKYLSLLSRMIKYIIFRFCILKVISIGKSVEHRDILVAKIGFSKPYKKPSIFIEAGKNIFNLR